MRQENRIRLKVRSSRTLDSELKANYDGPLNESVNGNLTFVHTYQGPQPNLTLIDFILKETALRRYGENTMTKLTEEHNDFKSILAWAEHLNMYPKASGNLSKEAFIELKSDINRILVKKNEFLAHSSLSFTAMLSTSSTRNALVLVPLKPIKL